MASILSRPQCVNSLWPSNAIWGHTFGSTWAQVKVCGLTDPRRYLNHCWLIIKGVLWYSPERNFTRNAHKLYLQYVFGYYCHISSSNEFRNTNRSLSRYVYFSVPLSSSFSDVCTIVWIIYRDISRVHCTWPVSNRDFYNLFHNIPSLFYTSSWYCIV